MRRSDQGIDQLRTEGRRDGGTDSVDPWSRLAVTDGRYRRAAAPLAVVGVGLRLAVVERGCLEVPESVEDVARGQVDLDQLDRLGAGVLGHRRGVPRPAE